MQLVLLPQQYLLLSSIQRSWDPNKSHRGQTSPLVCIIITEEDAIGFFHQQELSTIPFTSTERISSESHRIISGRQTH